MLGKGDGVRYSSYLPLVYKERKKSCFTELKINQATGRRFLHPAQRLVHPTTDSKSRFFFFLRYVCLWVLCLILCTVCFGAVSLTFRRCTCFSSCSVFSGVECPMDPHRLWTVMYTRSLSTAVLLRILNPSER